MLFVVRVNLFSLFWGEKKREKRSVCKPNWSVTFGFSSSQRGVDEILTHICSPHWLYSSRASSVARGDGTVNPSSGSDELVSAMKWNLATFTPLPRTYCNLTFHHLTTLSGQTFYFKLAIFWFMNKFQQDQIHFNQPNTLTSVQQLWSLKFGIVAVAILAFWPYLDKSGAGENILIWSDWEPYEEATPLKNTLLYHLPYSKWGHHVQSKLC